MKKFLIICLLFTGSLFAQDNSGFNSTQRASLRDSLGIRDLATTTLEAALLDSLIERDALISALSDSIALLTARIDTVGTSGLGSLLVGRFWIGDNAGIPAARTISGDFTINYLGVGSITAGSLVDADINSSASINPTKIKSNSLSIDQYEFSYLNNARSNLQTQIDNINVGTGYLLSTGDVVEGELDYNDNVSSNYGEDADLVILHNSTIPENSIYSTNADLNIMQTDANDILFSTNSIERWKFDSSGYFLPSLTKTYGIGSTSYEVKDIFAGRLKLTDSLNLGDNDYLTMGTGRDFIAYHDGVSTTNLNALFGNLVLKNSSATGDIYINTNGSYRWGFNENGMFDPYAANTYDIGYNNTVRSLYLGTNLYLGGATIGSIMSDSMDTRLVIDNDPDESSAATYTVDMSSTDIYEASLTPDERDLDVYFSNYGKGITHKIKVYQTLGNDITIHAPSGKTLIWLDGLEVEVTETGKYIFWFSWSPDDELEVSWGLFK